MAETTICLKQYINQEDYRKIEELRKACTEKEDIFLKVELDFMINISLTHSDEPFENINEFFYYSGDTLAGYLGIYNFGGVAAEITGMVHPLFRRKGIFRILYNLAVNECIRRKFEKILLVCDRRSDSGLSFIKSTEAVYSFSEYEMKFDSNSGFEGQSDIILRKASNSDADEIARQNCIYFENAGKSLIMPEEEEERGRITYMVESEAAIIGKIKVDFGEEGFISAFGILPEYRRKGYGRKALREALNILNRNNIHMVGLEVAAQNINALGLYKSCGFEEQSVTDYYEVKSI